MKPKISIVFPTYDSGGDLPQLIESLRKCNILERADVIAVDAESKDRTRDILDDAGIHWITINRKSSKGDARNLGIQHATGNVIVQTDSDVEFVEGWYEALYKTISWADIVAGFSPDPYGKHLNRVPIWIDGQDITYPTCNIAYRKEVHDKVGLFSTVQNMPEDLDMNYRCVKAGYSIIYNPKMKLFHRQRLSKIGFARQAFWNGEARYEINKKYPELTHSHQHGASVKNLFRLGFGFLGFTMGKFYRNKGEKVDRGFKSGNN